MTTKTPHVIRIYLNSKISIQAPRQQLPSASLSAWTHSRIHHKTRTWGLQSTQALNYSNSSSINSYSNNKGRCILNSSSTNRWMGAVGVMTNSMTDILLIGDHLHRIISALEWDRHQGEMTSTMMTGSKWEDRLQDNSDTGVLHLHRGNSDRGDHHHKVSLVREGHHLTVIEGLLLEETIVMGHQMEGLLKEEIIGDNIS